MTKPAQDLFTLLHEAIADARAAGLDLLADSLEQTSSACYTTSSELLGEVGLAIVTFLRAGGDAVPPAVAAKLAMCLQQVQAVWPRIRI